MSKINNDWKEILEEEFQKDYFVKLKAILEEEYKNYTVYPLKKDILNAFFLTPYSEAKVVLLGQDPYHQKGQAHGLAFSVNYGIKTPPSLVNMYKELHDDLGLYIPNNGFLEKWAKQGVLLLNTTLTVRDSQANSHSGIGWQTFTDNVIKALNEREKPIIFILWGNNAKSKEKFIDTNKHYILKGVHPSPLSANKGFFGCKHFSEANRILKNLGEKEIDWQIENKEI
ncbi:uracil-DNA glycosylase [Fusobacterium animalis]|uniref:uracil-DNA glycosylase n=1 Tax=Fusobacterium TaxID=848 RepID=UPI00033BB579|nr:MULTISPECIES: uracil-DNA glycosylase [Fusobacterium]MCL4584133.1 uracil-DNA glycosylase [Fusobacterium nucleatum YWH7054]CDA07130.1 uracil-DNA glycosylase [Fusobacterium sp. CAG:649]